MKIIKFSFLISVFALFLSSCQIFQLFTNTQEPPKPNYVRIQGTNFEIYNKYLTYKVVGSLNQIVEIDVMDWDKAVTLCNELGEGWRLPTNSELKVMGINIGLWGGSYSNHWGANIGKMTAVGFAKNGPESFADGMVNKRSEFRVRPVRIIY